MITAAVDGSSLSNPGPAGWCWFISETAWAAGGWRNATNNVAELTAVLNLLQATAHLDEPLVILCDSQYVINSLTKWLPGWRAKGWLNSKKEPVKNRELIETVDAALQGRAVTFSWVKGHAGQPMNEAADDHARAYATALQEGRTPNPGPGLLGSAGIAGAASETTPAAAPVEEPVPAVAGDPMPQLPLQTSEVDWVIDAERSLLTEAVRGNPARLRELLHENYVEYAADGAVWTKPRLVVAIHDTPGGLVMSDLSAHRIAPDVILLRWRGRRGTRETLQSSVWIRTEDIWQRLFAQATPRQSR